MNPNLAGRTYRSDSLVYALSTSFTVKMDFLAQARQCSAPEVSELDFVFTGTVGGVTGGALGRDAAKVFDNLRFRDDDEVFNLSGAGARVLEQFEVGNKQIDPTDIASGATNASYRYILRFLFEPTRRAQRPRDFRVPLAHFLEGGELVISTPAAVPTGWAAVQADQRIQVFARVIDGRQRELKSRRRVKEEAVTQQEFDYQVNGSLRNAFLTSKLLTTGYTSLAGFTTFYSRTLETIPSYQTAMAVDEYRREADSLGTNDEFTLATPGAIPIKAARNRQKIGEMIDTKTLHLDLGAAAPTSGRLITDVVVDRSSNMAALTEGFASPAALGEAIKSKGVVVGENGNIPARMSVPTLARRLPVRIKSGM